MDRISFTKDEEIELILSRMIGEPYVCKDIIKLKNRIEEYESRMYHCEMWNLVVSEYFRGIDRTYAGYTGYTGSKGLHIRDETSYIINLATEPQYIARKDLVTGYYQLTNVSYQVRELVMSLINGNVRQKTHGIDSPKQSYDKYFGILAKLIMDAMREKYSLN